jgi:glyoxylase-like metal-dependent hydrolase (beta-lactamase superfamily II)
MSSCRRSLPVWVGYLLLPLAPSLQAQVQAPAPVAVKRSIEKITDNVYRATNNNHSTVFLVTDQGIALADPINRGFAEWFKAEAARQFKVPVKYVIYSHHHWDHASGGAVFADTAQFVGQANILKNLAMPPAGTRLTDIVGEFAVTAALDTNHDGFVDQSEAKGKVTDAEFTGFDADLDGRLNGPEVARGPLSDVQPPTTTYVKEREIKFGGHRIQLTWMGRMNHSDDMTLITFPDDSVLFAVDYIDASRLPYHDMDYTNGMFNEWMAAVKRTERIAASYKFVVTGHSKTVGTAADLTAWREYVETLRSNVAAGIARGENLEQLQSTIKMEKYSSWTGYSWVADNVVGMYHFLTDGVAVKRKSATRTPIPVR